MAILRVVQVGPQVTLQDAGRFGHMRWGVPASGPMDRGAARAAHAALDNVADTAVIEVSLGGLTLDCVEGVAGFAVAGGGFQVWLGDVAVGPWCVGQIAAGQRLTIAPGRWGRWAYLAFKGGMAAKEWLGSVATHAQSGLGGGTVAVGDDLRVPDSEARARAMPCPVWARVRRRVRVVMGPQQQFFDTAELATFGTAAFRLTDAADRMGVRLAGPALVPYAVDMPSQAIVRGSVQVAGDGVATVLLADHQTTGGYPKIATILSCDTDGFAQLRAHDVVRFRAVTPGDAISAARLQQMMEKQYLQALGQNMATASGRDGRMRS